MIKSDALNFAIKHHGNQKYGDKPYAYHLNKVVELATTHFADSPEILSASALHDVIEDTNIGYNKIAYHFGKEVAEIVYCVTDELGRNRKERKEKTYPKIRRNWKATAVKLCDRIENVKESINNKDDIKLSMYKSEQKDFQLNVKSSFHPVKLNQLWNQLNQLLNQKL